MKLYEINCRNHDLDYATRYVHSRKEAGALARGWKEYQIAEVTIPDRITTADWISLLECDAPGMQELTKTPRDFISERTILKVKKHETTEGV